MTLPEITAGKIVQLVILCLVVGFAMSVLGIGPDEFWRWVIRMGERALRLVKTIFTNGLDYLLVGAAVVVPIYAIVFLSKVMKKKP